MIIKNIMVDAKTTTRWYFVITMGRKAGHLALGIGKAAGSTLTLIPEEFGEKKVRLKKVVDILVGAITNSGLSVLDLSSNQITARGCRSLAALLETPNCNLEKLFFCLRVERVNPGRSKLSNSLFCKVNII